MTEVVVVSRQAKGFHLAQQVKASGRQRFFLIGEYDTGAIVPKSLLHLSHRWRKMKPNCAHASCVHACISMHTANKGIYTHACVHPRASSQQPATAVHMHAWKTEAHSSIYIKCFARCFQRHGKHVNMHVL